MSDKKCTRHSVDLIGMTIVLQIILIALKIANLIEWNWVQVLIPTFIVFGIIVVAWSITFVYVLIQKLKQYKYKKGENDEKIN